MPTPTYTPLANITLSSTASTITFSSISQSYRDLILVTDATTSQTKGLLIRANNDSGANYSYVYAYTNGSSPLSGSGSGETFYTQASVATQRGVNIIQFMDYSATDKHKVILVRMNIAGNQMEMAGERWANTSAITSLTLSMSSTPVFATGSSFALYGIAA